MKSKFLSAAIFVSVLSLSGCSGTAQPDPAQANLEHFAQYYNQYVGEHQGKSPPSEDALKQFLAAKKVPDLDKLFISPRDNQPYRIKYSGSASPDYSKGLVAPNQAENQVIIAEEQTGAGGKRWVAYNTGVIKEVQ
jgi:hypothetical protein